MFVQTFGGADFLQSASSSCLFGYEPVHTELCVYIGRLF
jgi:hypothetical protein